MRPTPEQIDEIIIASGLTPSSAAEALGVAPRTVRAWLAGKHKPNLKHSAWVMTRLLAHKPKPGLFGGVGRWVYRFVGKGRVERRMVARESVEVRALRADVRLWKMRVDEAAHIVESLLSRMALLRRQLENSQAECHDERCKRLALGDELDKVTAEQPCPVTDWGASTAYAPHAEKGEEI